MSAFYLEAGGELYAMNATEKISRRVTGSLSNSLVEDGRYSSDNYLVKQTILSFSGIITDIKSFDDNTNRTCEGYLNGLKRHMQNKTPISVHYSNIQPPDANCFFTSFSHSQDKENGNSGTLNSFKVNFTLQKIRLAKGARVVPKPSAILAEKVSRKENKNSTTKKVDTKNLSATGKVEFERVLAEERLKRAGQNGG